MVMLHRRSSELDGLHTKRYSGNRPRPAGFPTDHAPGRHQHGSLGSRRGRPNAVTETQRAQGPLADFRHRLDQGRHQPQAKTSLPPHPAPRAFPASKFAIQFSGPASKLRKPLQFTARLKIWTAGTFSGSGSWIHFWIDTWTGNWILAFRP